MKLSVSLPVILAAILAGSIALNVRACNRASRAEAAANQARAQAADQDRLTAAGTAYARQVEREQLQAKLAAAETASAGLKGQLETARKALKNARPVTVVTGTTGPVPVFAPQTLPSGSQTSGSVSPPAAPACLLAAGDRGEVRVSAAAVEGASGVIAVVGTAEAWRVDPPLRLFGGDLRLDVTVETQRQRAPGWAYGLGGGVSGRGFLGALSVRTPPRTLPLLHWPVRGWGVAAGNGNQGLLLLGIEVEP